MKRAAVLSLATALLCLPLAAQPASIALFDAKIFTNDPAKPTAQALAIDDDKIIAVGTNAEILPLTNNNTRRFRLNGAVVIPGINDAHMHPSVRPEGFGLSVGIDAPFSVVRTAIQAAIDETPPDLLIFGTVGGPVINDPAVTRQALDALAPGRKIILTSFTGHGMIVSSAAMTFLGLSGNEPDPNGGRFERNANGVFNGRIFEYAQYPLMRKLADSVPQDQLDFAMEQLMDEAVRFGITSLQAMPMMSENAFIQSMQRIRPPLRIRIIRFPTSAPLATLALPPQTPPQRVPLKGLKWILDGTPIEKGAAVRTPYPGGGLGRENFADIKPLIQNALDLDEQLLVHAAGDKTIATVLATLGSFQSINWKLKRPRLEHGDGLQNDLFLQARNQGVVVVQNPSHFPFRAAYPAGQYFLMKTLLAKSIPLAIGSDGPLNPYLNIAFAVSRPDTPAEALTPEEAVTAYTSGSAFAEFAENQKGRLKVGFLADLAVLSQDIFTVRRGELANTRSLLTIIGGKIAHEEPIP